MPALAASLLPACAAGTTFGFDDSGLGGEDTGAVDTGRDEAAADGGKGHPDATRPDSSPGDSRPGDASHPGDAAKEGATEAAADVLTACIISGSTYPSGTTNPADACQTCDPAKSTSGWTSLADGMSCGSGEVCHAGACDSGCFVSGTYYALNAANPMNACQTCQPSTSTTAWTDQTDGSGCGSGEVCFAGTCSAGCYIASTFYMTGAADPLNSCQSCQPTASPTSTTAWTNATNETACAGGRCCSGSCFDESKDTSHCGGCGNVCPTVTNGTPDCVSSICGTVCNAGYVLSGTMCVAVSSPCTVTFPDTVSTTGGTDYPGTLGPGGTSEYRWHAGDYVEESYACSRASITQLTVDFQMSDSTDSACSGTLFWNVMINGTVVGTYSWFGGAGPSTHTISQTYTFSPIAAVGGLYTLEYYSTTTVCSGGGNWDWIPGGSATVN